MPTNPTPSDVLATLQGYAAWALVRMGDDDTVLAVGGSRSRTAKSSNCSPGSRPVQTTAATLLAVAPAQFAGTVAGKTMITP